mmetsp:Transcript_4635/g.5366  ORF Transcript_4635/g.5366 Transcript_4635/m.5366 type:complete len:91 (+) Transcript_4635:271-543(+)
MRMVVLDSIWPEHEVLRNICDCDLFANAVAQLRSLLDPLTDLRRLRCSVAATAPKVVFDKCLGMPNLGNVVVPQQGAVWVIAVWSAGKAG